MPFLGRLETRLSSADPLQKTALADSREWCARGLMRGALSIAECSLARRLRTCELGFLVRVPSSQDLLENRFERRWRCTNFPTTTTQRRTSSEAPRLGEASPQARVRRTVFDLIAAREPGSHLAIWRYSPWVGIYRSVRRVRRPHRTVAATGGPRLSRSRHGPC